MPPVAERWRAVGDVLLVFGITLLAVGLVARSPLSRWELACFYRPFAEYFLLGLIPLVIMLRSRLGPSPWGLSLRTCRQQVNVAKTCLLPFALGHALTMVTVRAGTLQFLVETIIAVVVTLVCVALLRNRPPLVIPVLLFLASWGPSHTTPGRALSALLFYTLFLGPGEELLFRGFIQSRLNQAFLRRYVLLGIPLSGGLLIAALLFAVFHVLNLPRLYAGSFEPLWWKGIPTFAWGLFFGYVREKTGGLIAPAILHGVPQGLAWAFLGL